MSAGEHTLCGAFWITMAKDRKTLHFFLSSSLTAEEQEQTCRSTKDNGLLALSLPNCVPSRFTEKPREIRLLRASVCIQR
ncbi:hypothetical protein CDAR_498391 [Caerostris darwini]|uniref:Uncharacterized protein n=1 Tax=Caerostris darwini TaxID=1538125 RepID=A0AAV4PPQ0_9ARAC|nr:hypothetical protein CDAR_498391 [Caerostris darwini]